LQKFSAILNLTKELERKTYIFQNVLPILIEQINLTDEIILQDLETRKLLSHSLNLSHLPNSGYLAKEQMRSSTKATFGGPQEQNFVSNLAGDTE